MFGRGGDRYQMVEGDALAAFVYYSHLAAAKNDDWGHVLALIPQEKPAQVASLVELLMDGEQGCA